MFRQQEWKRTPRSLALLWPLVMNSSVDANSMNGKLKDASNVALQRNKLSIFDSKSNTIPTYYWVVVHEKECCWSVLWLSEIMGLAPAWEWCDTVRCQEVPILPKSKYLPPSVPTYDNSVDGGWNLTLLIYSLIITIQVMNEMEHMFWSKGVLPPNLDFR